LRNVPIIVALMWLSTAESASAADARFTSESAASISRVDVQSEARRVLTEALERKYSGVTTWQLSPRLDGGIPAQFVNNPPTSVAVLHAGPRSAVRATWSQSGAAEQSHTLWFDVQGVESVWVATHEIPAGTAVSAADVAEEVRDAVALGCTPVTTVATLLNMRTRRVVRRGQAMCREGIEPRPAVARGEAVTVRYFSARISISTQAIAQQDADIGQKLRVVNPANRDSFSAVVTGVREAAIRDIRE
jgi:flagella basal body P-ring formation protein FlgA